jgi:hypothetical protein
MSDEIKLIPTNREVIENQLLAALDDKTKVAILANEEDLSVMMLALTYASKSGGEPFRGQCLSLVSDFSKLKHAAFPK